MFLYAPLHFKGIYWSLTQISLRCTFQACLAWSTLWHHVHSQSGVKFGKYLSGKGFVQNLNLHCCHMILLIVWLFDSDVEVAVYADDISYQLYSTTKPADQLTDLFAVTLMMMIMPIPPNALTRTSSAWTYTSTSIKFSGQKCLILSSSRLCQVHLFEIARGNFIKKLLLVTYYCQVQHLPNTVTLIFSKLLLMANFFFFQAG